MLSVGLPLTVWTYSRDKLFYDLTLLDTKASDEITQTFPSIFPSDSFYLLTCWWCLTQL